MADIVVAGNGLQIQLTRGEQVAGLRSGVTVPMAQVRAVRVVPDGLLAARGLRAPGLGVPGVRKIGTWRSRSGRMFVSVRRDEPAVLIRLHRGSAWHALLIGSPRAAELAARVTTGLAPELRDEPVVIDPEHGALHGSLRVPGPGPMPGALLLAGSGPIDRDGDAPGNPLELQLALAEALAQEGVASLRYDRRGVGDGTDWRAVGLSENTADAARALRTLRSDPRIDAERIVVIGHSEGALHALRLAVGDEAPAAAVLLSSPARPGGEVLLWQAEQIAPGLPRPVQAIVKVARIDVTAKTRAAHDKLRATTGDVARVNGAKINAGWFREFLDDDPREQLASLAIPTLALTGTADLQTPVEDAAAIAELATGPVDVVQPEQISHLLRSDPSEAPALSDYRRQLREPVDAVVLRTVTDWVAGRLG
jgi:pimeloyl-ACP methyl ester carboxylesterase